MARRSFIFCDICNPLAIRDIEMRRNTGRCQDGAKDKGKGRRITDGRAWFDGSDEEAQTDGWVPTEDGQHICPTCFERMKSMRHVLEEHLFVSVGLSQVILDRID
ncbi:MAG: hypothetical protein HZB71_01005 [Betaproteobacteria bacterium]|nr:hypothetical protein [Betaproteobacteria bacterium]